MQSRHQRGRERREERGERRKRRERKEERGERKEQNDDGLSIITFFFFEGIHNRTRLASKERVGPIRRN
jgi:hypothetical protein